MTPPLTSEARDCDWCGSSYMANIRRLARGWDRHCSKSCANSTRNKERAYPLVAGAAITTEEAHSIFAYDPSVPNGIRWKINRSRARAGDPAGVRMKGGYYGITISGRRYANHHIVFLMHHGRLPASLDHRDRNPSHNNIENLREATQMQNMWNVGVRADSKSGHKGVFFSEKTGKWSVRIKANKKAYNLGTFSVFEDAVAVYRAKATELHGEFARW